MVENNRLFVLKQLCIIYIFKEILKKIIILSDISCNVIYHFSNNTSYDTHKNIAPQEVTTPPFFNFEVLNDSK